MMFTHAQEIEFEAGKTKRHVLLPARHFAKGGRDIDVTSDVLSAMVANFTTRRPVTIAHPDLESAEAVGWVTSVEMGEHAGSPALVGVVEWSDKAAQAIEGKRYGYLSPVFSTSGKSEDGADVGPRLLAVGVTNNPHWSSDQPELWAAFCASLGHNFAADAARGDEMSKTAEVETRVAELEASVVKLTAERDAAIEALGVETQKHADEVLSFADTQAQLATMAAQIREQRGAANLAKYAAKLLDKHLKTSSGDPTPLALAAYDDSERFEFMAGLIPDVAQDAHTQAVGGSGEPITMTAEEQAMHHARGEAEKADLAQRAGVYASAYDNKLAELKGN